MSFWLNDDKESVVHVIVQFSFIMWPHYQSYNDQASEISVK